MNTLATVGTKTTIPISPTTTEGIDANMLIKLSMTDLTFLLAYLEIYIDDNNPTGTAKTVAAAVPYTLVKINGKMPKAGSCAVEAHFLPNRKLINPISLIAGIPDTIK